MTLILKAKNRDLKTNLKNTRKEGLIPAVLYGHGVENKNLTLAYHEFEKLYRQAGESSLIDLEIEGGKPVKVLVHDIQKDPLKDSFIHVDLYQVKMTEELSAEVELNFVGESPAVKELGGILVKNIQKLHVKCLPGDLVNKIEVDLSSLKAFGSTIHVSDLPIPSKIKVQNKPEEVVVTVSEPRSEEELKSLEEKVEEKVVEVEKVGEKKPEEGAEGTEAAEGAKGAEEAKAGAKQEKK